MVASITDRNSNSIQILYMLLGNLADNGVQEFGGPVVRHQRFLEYFVEQRTIHKGRSLVTCCLYTILEDSPPHACETVRNDRGRYQLVGMQN